MAPIIDLTMATPNNQQGRQSELLIASGINHQTFMSLVKKGIQLNSLQNLAEMGLTQVSDVFSAGDLLMIKCYNYDMPLCLKVTGDSFEGQELPR